MDSAASEQHNEVTVLGCLLVLLEGFAVGGVDQLLLWCGFMKQIGASCSS